MSSNYDAGVPIKKRRFPIIRPSSPTHEEKSLVPLGNGSVQKEYTSQSQGSVLSNASNPTCSSSLSDVNRDSVLEKVKGNTDGTNVRMVHSIASSVKLKIEEPSPTAECPVSRLETDSNIKHVAPEKNAKNELTLLPSETPALNTGKDASSDSDLSRTSGITELSLGINKHLFSSMASQVGGSCRQNKENGGSVLSNLSSSKGETIDQWKCNVFQLNTGGSIKCTNRSNWDLNTTMDVWDGSVVSQVSGQVAAETSTGTHDIKPLIFSVGMVGSGVASRKQKNESTSNASTLPDLSSHRCNPEDNLHLRLSPSFPQSNPTKNPSSSSALLNSDETVHNMGLRKAFLLSGNSDNVNIRIVKSEPLDESDKLGFEGTTDFPIKLLDFQAVESELVKGCNPKALESSTLNPAKLVDPRSIKPEPVHVVVHKKVEGTSNHSDEMMPSDQNSLRKSTSSADLSVSGNVANSSEHPLSNQRSRFSEEMPQKADSANLRATDTTIASVIHDNNVANPSGIVDSKIAEDKNVYDPERCELKFVDAAPAPSDSREDGEGSGSDDEKVNLSGDVLDEDYFGTEYDSDSNHDRRTVVNTEPDGIKQEDFEDGEVREPLADSIIKEPVCEKREVEPFNGDDSHEEQINFLRLRSDGHPSSSFVENKDSIAEEPSGANCNILNKCSEPVHYENANEGVDDKDRLRDLSAVEMPTDGAVNCPEGKETEQSSYQAAGADQENSENAVQGFDEDVNINDVIDKDNAALPKVETFMNVDDATKNANSGGHKSRIINLRTNGAANCLRSQENEQSPDQARGARQRNLGNFQVSDVDVNNTDLIHKKISALPKVQTSMNVDDSTKGTDNAGQKSRIINLRASVSSSPGKTSALSARSMPMRAGRIPDLALEEERFCSRGRHEVFSGDSYKFSRDRHHNSSRNSRLNFGRGRGRISSRIDSLCGDCDSEQDFAPDFYTGPPEFRLHRHKYTSKTDLQFNSYNGGLNGAFAGTGRGGRKPLNDEVPGFRLIRRSPGGREGPPERGLDMGMVRRIPRNISPSGCVDEGSSELVGLRHGEEFMRGLANDNPNSMYTHAQASYEGIESQFVRGNRNFLSVQGRGHPSIRSKSPIASRSRAPGTWSPRRRSSDGFGGHSEFVNQRSPPTFRMERMRSPDHSYFPGEMVVRRHGSPYMCRQSNELRDMDSGRCLGQPRSVIPNRSPSGTSRATLRNTRRFDMVDPRERTDNDDFFGRPMQFGRYQEPGADRTSEERRRFSERRGPVRPFRPPFNSPEDENLHLNAENGPRSFRFRPGDDSNIHNRGHLREREFDRRIKDPHGNAPRRTRNIEEEQEGNFRHPGHVSRDEGFDNISRIKRKRF